MPVTEEELAARAVAPRVTERSIDDKISDALYINPEGTSLTICVLTLWNGFHVIGQSASASAANFDPEIGKRLALTNAKNKIWELEGYRLRSDLHLAGK